MVTHKMMTHTLLRLIHFLEEISYQKKSSFFLSEIIMVIFYFLYTTNMRVINVFP